MEGWGKRWKIAANLAQLIDPERALTQVDRKSRAAEAPSIRTHLRLNVADARRAPAKPGHPHRPTAGAGTSLRTLKALVTSPAPLHFKQIAALIGITPQKASMALTHLHHAAGGARERKTSVSLQAEREGEGNRMTDAALAVAKCLHPVIASNTVYVWRNPDRSQGPSAGWSKISSDDEVRPAKDHEVNMPRQRATSNGCIPMATKPVPFVFGISCSARCSGLRNLAQRNLLSCTALAKIGRIHGAAAQREREHDDYCSFHGAPLFAFGWMPGISHCIPRGVVSRVVAK